MKKVVLTLIIMLFTLSLFAFDVEMKEIKDIKDKDWIINVTYPFLKGDSKPVKTINESIEKEIKAGVEEFKEECYFDDEFRPSFPFEFESLKDSAITLNTDKIFSAVVHVMTYTGGAHPNCGFYTFNYIVEDDAVKRLSLTTLFGNDLEKVKNLLLPLINKERKLRTEMDLVLEKLEDDMLVDFSMDPFGVNFIFPQYCIGAYAEGEYIISVPWEDLSPFIRNATIKSYIDNKKARVNVSGKVVLDDVAGFPYGAKIVVSLLAKLDPMAAKKTPLVLESKVFLPEQGENTFPFKVSYDFTDLIDSKEYLIETDVYYSDVLAFKNMEEIPLTEKGLKEYDFVVKHASVETFDKWGYIRLKSTVVPNDEGIIPYDSYYEFRLNDKNFKTVKKLFMPMNILPCEMDITFDTKDLKDNEYYFDVLIAREGETYYENHTEYIISKTKQTLPEEIKVYNVMEREPKG
ncbi:MAG: DUF4163 domain-containing protein [Abditibacteriota bacterium]|nr:DUF4163 domain-containing protein [Abditibacteriota bacterium]